MILCILTEVPESGTIIPYFTEEQRGPTATLLAQGVSERQPAMGLL